ncbi:MAG TPA: XRE family transcriptional regulator [Marmoricola sp.]|jgi:transcriptional regulator with XRE-family HTH domain|nr:XRE family transcriptional regulator [Marmoricola sp.]
MPRSEHAKGLATAMGARLRERRNELGLSLSEAARRAEVSASYLTAVENGTSTPSLPVLSRVAHALEITIGEFLADDTGTAVELGSLGNRPGTQVVSSDALQLQIAFQTSTGTESGSCPFEIEGTTVFAYVRSGQLDVSVDGETWRLEEGDSLHASEPHEVTWSAPGQPSTVVWAVAPTSLVEI